MKRRDFLKLSRNAALVTAAFPVLAKTNELKPILNEDGSQWCAEFPSMVISKEEVFLRNKTNPLFRGGDLQWTQDEINKMRSRQVKALSFNKIKR